MTDIIALAVVLTVVALAAGYIIRAKRRGEKCIGCPHSGSCSGRCGGAVYLSDAIAEDGAPTDAAQSPQETK